MVLPLHLDVDEILLLSIYISYMPIAASPHFLSAVSRSHSPTNHHISDTLQPFTKSSQDQPELFFHVSFRPPTEHL